jgi:hypothetical protein
VLIGKASASGAQVVAVHAYTSQRLLGEPLDAPPSKRVDVHVARGVMSYGQMGIAPLVEIPTYCMLIARGV